MFLSLCLAIALVLCGALNAAEGGGGRPPAPVHVIALAEESVHPTTRLVGQLRATELTEIAAQEPEQVLEVLVRAGDTLSADAVIARLDDTRLKSQRAALDAERAASEAAAERLRAELERAEADAEALGRAADSQAVSRIEARRARSEVATLEADLAAAEASTQAIASNLEVFDVRLQDLVIRAPFNGEVVQRYVDPGSWVGTGAPVVRLRALAVEVRADVPERFWTAVRQHADQLTIRWGDEVIASGAVRSVGALDPTTRTFPVIAPIPEIEDAASGLSVSVLLPIAAASRMLVVPRSAVIRDGRNASMFLAQPQSGGPATAVPVQVRIQADLGERYAISGVDGPPLRPGAWIIVEGNERLRPGQTVQPMPADPQAPMSAGMQPPTDLSSEQAGSSQAPGPSEGGHAEQGAAAISADSASSEGGP